MINDIQDEIIEGFEQVDKNSIISERVRKHSLVGRYYDNKLRLNYKLITIDLLKLHVLFVIIFLIFYNKMIIGVDNNEELIRMTTTQFGLVCVAVIEKITNNTIILVNNIFYLLNTYSNEVIINEFKKVVMLSEEERLPFQHWIAIITFDLCLFIIFLFSAYRLFTSKILLLSQLSNHYIPLWALYHFYKRNKLGYFYSKLITHQDNKTISNHMAKNVLSNLFDNFKHIDLKQQDKVEIIFELKKFIFYDFFKVSYKINEEVSIVKNNDNNSNDNVKEDIEELEEHIEEVEEKVDKNKSSKGKDKDIELDDICELID